MARKPGVEFDGAFYHVIVRGNQRQKTFQDDWETASSRCVDDQSFVCLVSGHRVKQTEEKVASALEK